MVTTKFFQKKRAQRFALRHRPVEPEYNAAKAGGRKVQAPSGKAATEPYGNRLALCSSFFSLAVRRLSTGGNTPDGAEA